MPANECIPYKVPGDAVTAKAIGAITGKRFVKIAGNRTGGGGGGAEGVVTVGVGLSTDVENLYQVSTATAGARCFGVSGWDAIDKGELKVYLDKTLILPVKAGEALTAGWLVESNATGEAVKYVEGAGKYPNGLVLNGAESGKDAEIMLL